VKRIVLLACCLALVAMVGSSSECQHGSYWWRDTGNCCAQGGIEQELLVCKGGSWYGTGTFQCGAFIPGCPPPI
jgi:hypothetical protein